MTTKMKRMLIAAACAVGAVGAIGIVKVVASHAGGCEVPADQASMVKAYRADQMIDWTLPNSRLLSKSDLTHACDAHFDAGSPENSRGPWFAVAANAYRVDRLYKAKEIVASVSSAATAGQWVLLKSLDMPDPMPDRSSTLVEYCKLIRGRPAALDLRVTEGANPDQSTRLDVSIQTIPRQSC